MELVEPQLCEVSVDKGLLTGGNGHYRKTFADLAGLYADAPAFDALLTERARDTAYEVTTYTPPGGAGDVIMGITRMEPGRVGREFFLTRGHIHANGNRPEVYYGQKGHGLMVMESPEGEVRLCEVRPQGMLYVPPYWIHRSVNLGEGDLVMMFCYPADSGQDYGIIERSGGMRVRIVTDGSGGWRQEDNPAYRPRTAEEVAAVYRSGRDAAA